MSSEVLLVARKKGRSLAPYVRAIMAFGHDHDFAHVTSEHHRRIVNEELETKGSLGAPLNAVFAGISIVFSDSNEAMIALAIHNYVYLLDFCVNHVNWNDEHSASNSIADLIISRLSKYEREHLCKILGAGLPQKVIARSPTLCSRLWAELDVIPVSLHDHSGGGLEKRQDQISWESRSVEEQADSMARKYFGPNQTPLLQVGFRGEVQVDAGYHAHMVTVDDFRKTVGAGTWDSMMQYATDLKQRKVKIAFFSSTPQGGGVALMRHALVRFSRVLGVDVKWYVPKPKPGIFRITKTNHNILQGVAEPDVRLTAEHKKSWDDWVRENAERYWLPEGGPLAPPAQGGADFIVVDDPQMPGIIPLAKAITPDRPVVYRSHIELRGDLISKAGTPQADLWGYLWEKIKWADLFISHPIQRFVPSNVPISKVGYMPASSDWLDGLNKNLNDWDHAYYGHMFNTLCQEMRMPKLNFRSPGYIVQVARFDPAKGIPDVIKSYALFHDKLRQDSPHLAPPQLLVCGHGSIDDPDGSLVYDQTVALLSAPAVSSLIPRSAVTAIRLPPTDQLLNTLLSQARIALQLSLREGFEIKVSEALRKGIPVIATRTGGIPLQIQHGRNGNGFLVDVGDVEAVAGHLYDLWTDEGLYARMSKRAAAGVSDEVGTVGNALAWAYLAATLSRGGGGEGKLEMNGRWVNDMAREEAEEPYKPEENRMPREALS